ncbi:MAG: SDR family oxidoreductase [bacterium]|nr:SDR family oxidoreductase [bacterium]
MRYVVTGGAGFIASHLVERLLDEGNQVVALDNFITGARENVKPFLDNDGFTFIERDISLPYEISGEIDYVLHMASPASPIDFTRIPFEIMQAGSEGTRLACELALQKGARLLFASTSEVYGDPEVHPQVESYRGAVSTIGPRAPYDEAKRFGEAMVSAYRRTKGLDTRIIRIFNTYGPRMRPDDGRVIPNFISQALRGEPLTVYGDGSQTRSLCYVTDMVDGILKLLHSDFPGPVNIGNPREYTVIEIADIIAEIVNPDMGRIFEELPKDDPKRRRPDISLAREKLGWEPRVPAEEGLKLTIEWFKTKLGL